MIFFKVGTFNSIAPSRETVSTNCVAQTSVYDSINRRASNWNAIAALNLNFAQLKLVIGKACFPMLMGGNMFLTIETVSLRTGSVPKNIFFNETVLSGLNDEALV